MNIKITKLISMTLKMLENDIEVDKIVCDDSTGEVIFDVNYNNEIILTRNLLDHLIDEFEQDCEEQRTVAYETGKQIGYKQGYDAGHKEGYDSGHKDAIDEIFPSDDIMIDVKSDIKNFD